ncbi:Shedu anti-phage system protein SduA domain-containing protein [Cecembia rubra]|uniref:Uncharacterized protein DUF4263 n=1 Tax=Cecembia rubra TaxID=1485585 RepID=A0A2P8DVI5_9BACT|nr:Shedu anti-phage system protein SduA domain-containing protein [Cecembia rubra]PSL01232.1 uncharacterized protein DUF4263 [Cecembia rubra]
MAVKKEPIELLKTKLNRCINGNMSLTNRSLKAGNKILIKYNQNFVEYTENGYTYDGIDRFYTRDYTVKIELNRENLSLISSSSSKPDKNFGFFLGFMKNITAQDLNKVVISNVNKVEPPILYTTKSLFEDYKKIAREEGIDKNIRIRNRVAPYLKNHFDIELNEAEAQKDYSLVLKEIIASNQVSQADIIELTGNLETGENINLVVEKKINKQVDWLITTIEEQILSKSKITTADSKTIGNTYFGFPKIQIKGPEDLMEKILTKYGQYTFFGVPAMINTNKYVIHHGDLSRSQLDLILITHLGDIELVELKRSDEILMDFDFGRKKFYPTKTLAAAISQCERYITTINRDNDESFKIDNKKIRDFLQEQIGADNLDVESVRPTGTIIIGSSNSIFTQYENLNASQKAKISKGQYETNGKLAYKELKNTYKNIKVLTYSELVGHAKTRLQLDL